VAIADRVAYSASSIDGVGMGVGVMVGVAVWVAVGTTTSALAGVLTITSAGSDAARLRSTSYPDTIQTM
jgi:hypothetical protein